MWSHLAFWICGGLEACHCQRGPFLITTGSCWEEMKPRIHSSTFQKLSPISHAYYEEETEETTETSFGRTENVL